MKRGNATEFSKVLGRIVCEECHFLSKCPNTLTILTNPDATMVPFSSSATIKVPLPSSTSSSTSRRLLKRSCMPSLFRKDSMRKALLVSARIASRSAADRVVRNLNDDIFLSEKN
jgi:hypothetical protein